MKAEFVATVETAHVNVPHLVAPVIVTRHRQPDGGYLVEVEGLPGSPWRRVVDGNGDIDACVAHVLDRVAAWGEARAAQEPFRRATEAAWQSMLAWFDPENEAT